VNQTFRLGTAKIDISPQEPVPLAGFAHRTGNFESIAHPLYLKFLLFQQNDEFGQSRYALLVSADLIWWSEKFLAPLRRRLTEEYGLNDIAIILHATHNHSGPQTNDRFTSFLGEFREDYAAFVEERLFEGVCQAIETIEPVTIERGSTECDICINRRRHVNGKIIMAPNHDGPSDHEVNVIRFRTESGSTKAVLVHFTCHPTTTDENRLSSEFTGVAMSHIEAILGENAVAAFLQGFCGDIRPALIRGGSFYRGSDTEVCELGWKLAEQAMLCLSRPMESIGPATFLAKTMQIPLAFEALPSLIELKQKADCPGVVGEWARLLLAEPDRLRPTIPLELTFLRLAKGLSFLAMNAEMVVEYGLYVKQRFHGCVLPLGYSNGMIGYVPTAAQISEGGYEARDSFMYFGLPAPFDRLIETEIHKHIGQLGQFV
jgi:hypothetical protein